MSAVASSLTPPSPPRAILFDLDGTLIDTMQAFADVAADVMERHHGLAWELGRRRYLATSGIPFFQQLEAILPGDARNDAAAEEFERLKVDGSRDVLPDEETVETLRRLRGAGLRVAVCSNNFQEQVDEFARRCPVELDLALGFGGGLAKGPPHFDFACARFGCTRAELLFVGDSLADAALARQAGIRFVARLGTFAAGPFRAAAPEAPRIGRLAELLDVVGLAPVGRATVARRRTGRRG